MDIELFREHMLDYDGYKALFSDLHAYTLHRRHHMVLIDWARYNLLRFHDKESRKATMHVDPADQAQAFKLDPEQLRQWQRTKRMVIHHDPQHDIAGVERKARPAP